MDRLRGHILTASKQESQDLDPALSESSWGSQSLPSSDLILSVS